MTRSCDLDLPVFLNLQQQIVSSIHEHRKIAQMSIISSNPSGNCVSFLLHFYFTVGME
jgi:hypothetical protein